MSSLRHPDFTMSKQKEGSGRPPRGCCQLGGKQKVYVDFPHHIELKHNLRMLSSGEKNLLNQVLFKDYIQSLSNRCISLVGAK